MDVNQHKWNLKTLSHHFDALRTQNFSYFVCYIYVGPYDKDCIYTSFVYE